MGVFSKRVMLRTCRINLVKRGFESQTLADDSNEHVDRNCDPDLSLYGVLGGTVERLDSQVLFDPPEKEFHPPAGLVDFSDGPCGQIEVMSQEYETLVGF
jgi:hypothetical protein